MKITVNGKVVDTDQMTDIDFVELIRRLESSNTQISVLQNVLYGQAKDIGQCYFSYDQIDELKKELWRRKR